MDFARILIAMNNDASVMKIRSILAESGYIVIEHVKDGPECLRKMRMLEPDIIILDYELPLLTGYEVAQVALEDKICDVLLIVTDAQMSFINDLKDETGFVYLTKPLNKQIFITAIDLMVKSKKRVDRLQKEISDLKDALNTRKEIEKAKGILMKHLKLTEEEAFKRIQKQSMDKGVSMKEVARAIIVAYEI
ncbi:MAG: ANTAR domain-containing protein [Clostridia bacterium]|nr:ANTAR domain-containing protein [Clostridia bacterium]